MYQEGPSLVGGAKEVELLIATQFYDCRLNDPSIMKVNFLPLCNLISYVSMSAVHPRIN